MADSAWTASPIDGVWEPSSVDNHTPPLISSPDFSARLSSETTVESSMLAPSLSSSSRKRRRGDSDTAARDNSGASGAGGVDDEHKAASASASTAATAAPSVLASKDPSDLDKPAKSQKSKASDTPSRDVCAICLLDPTNVSALNNCMHRFCFACIREWTDTQISSSARALRCPLCNSDYTSILTDIVSDTQYREHVVQRPEPADPSVMYHRLWHMVQASRGAAGPAGLSQAEFQQRSATAELQMWQAISRGYSSLAPGQPVPFFFAAAAPIPVSESLQRQIMQHQAYRLFASSAAGAGTAPAYQSSPPAAAAAAAAAPMTSRPHYAYPSEPLDRSMYPQGQRYGAVPPPPPDMNRPHMRRRGAVFGLPTLDMSPDESQSPAASASSSLASAPASASTRTAAATLGEGPDHPDTIRQPRPYYYRVRRRGPEAEGTAAPSQQQQQRQPDVFGSDRSIDEIRDAMLAYRRSVYARARTGPTASTSGTMMSSSQRVSSDHPTPLTAADIVLPNSATLPALEPWLRRELSIILGSSSADAGLVAQMVLGLLSSSEVYVPGVPSHSTRGHAARVSYLVSRMRPYTLHDQVSYTLLYALGRVSQHPALGNLVMLDRAEYHRRRSEIVALQASASGMDSSSAASSSGLHDDNGQRDGSASGPASAAAASADYPRSTDPSSTGRDEASSIRYHRGYFAGDSSSSSDSSGSGSGDAGHLAPAPTSRTSRRSSSRWDQAPASMPHAAAAAASDDTPSSGHTQAQSIAAVSRAEAPSLLPSDTGTSALIPPTSSSSTASTSVGTGSRAVIDLSLDDDDDVVVRRVFLASDRPDPSTTSASSSLNRPMPVSSSAASAGAPSRRLGSPLPRLSSSDGRPDAIMDWAPLPAPLLHQQYQPLPPSPPPSRWMDLNAPDVDELMADAAAAAAAPSGNGAAAASAGTSVDAASAAAVVQVPSQPQPSTPVRHVVTLSSDSESDDDSDEDDEEDTSGSGSGSDRSRALNVDTDSDSDASDSDDDDDDDTIGSDELDSDAAAADDDDMKLPSGRKRARSSDSDDSDDLSDDSGTGTLDDDDGHARCDDRCFECKHIRGVKRRRRVCDDMGPVSSAVAASTRINGDAGARDDDDLASDISGFSSEEMSDDSDEDTAAAPAAASSSTRQLSAGMRTQASSTGSLARSVPSAGAPAAAAAGASKREVIDLSDDIDMPELEAVSDDERTPLRAGNTLAAVGDSTAQLHVQATSPVKPTATTASADSLSIVEAHVTLRSSTVADSPCAGSEVGSPAQPSNDDRLFPVALPVSSSSSVSSASSSTGSTGGSLLQPSRVPTLSDHSLMSFPLPAAFSRSSVSHTAGPVDMRKHHHPSAASSLVPSPLSTGAVAAEPSNGHTLSMAGNDAQGAASAVISVPLSVAVVDTATPEELSLRDRLLKRYARPVLR